MNEELTNDEVEIDLVDLGYVLLDKWRYLLISLIAGAVLLGAYSFFFIAPTYEIGRASCRERVLESG